MKINTTLMIEHPAEAEGAAADEVRALTPDGWTVTSVEIGDWDSSGSFWDEVEKRNVRLLRADMTLTIEDQR
jgi:hypothetical protein